VNLAKKIISKSIDKIDLVFSILVVPPAYLLKMYRLAGSRKMPRTTIRLEKIGVFPITNHYYEPLFDTRDLESSLIDPTRKPRGINLDVDAQVKFLRDLNFREEILAASWNVKANKNSSDFFLSNGAFESGDAEFLYQVIRRFRPKTVIEIGSGYSTRIVKVAISKNNSESASETRHICVEPYEHAELDSMENIEIVRDKIERFDFEWDTLKENDLIFIDSSHVIRPNGDVLKLYLEIIPLLPAGVIVHIHDIFTPRDYPKEWLVKDKRFWNEQYLVEMMLQNSSRYEILAALNFLKHEKYDELQEVCPYLTPLSEPGSIYLKVR
jgi:predicted O-methyltransferase YrrM